MVTGRPRSQGERSKTSRSILRWTLAAREKSSGRLAGFTELMLNPAKPLVAQQGNTGVLEIYRNQGLGRWLKAAMLRRLCQERPGNADSNAPMLKINTQLGFQPYQATSVVQVMVA